MQTDANSSSTKSHQTLALGQKLAGCYVLSREIASESGFSVWLAQDEVLGKDVTLHFVPAEILGDARAMAELRQEVKRNRQLIHPNILRVYDFVEDGGYAAISMDLLEGESLSKRLNDNGMFEPSDIRGWFKELTGTLDDAHRVQLFHRDLSPSNIYVRPNGGIVVSNFGVSRTVREGLERARTVAPEALHMAYMSPQQLDGEKPSRSDDVYGLGVLAFQLLSSSVPFSGSEIVTAIRTTPAPRISDFRGGAVPEEWESFAAACLAKKAEQRPPTCSAALAILDGGACSAPVVESESDAADREESISGVMAGAATVMGAGLGSGGLGSRSAGAERRVSFGGALDAPLSSPVKQEVEQVPAASAVSATSESSEKPSVSKSSQFPPPPPSPGKVNPALKSNLPANFPHLTRPKSKLPFVIVGSIAAAVAFLVFKKLNPPENSDGDPSASMAVEKVGTGTGDVAADPKSIASSALPNPGATLPNPGAETPAPNIVSSDLPKPEESEPSGLDKPPGDLIAASAESAQPPTDSAVKPVKPVPKKAAIIGENPPLTNPAHVAPVSPADPKVNVPPTPPVEPPKVQNAEVTPDKVVAGLSVKIPTLPVAPPKLQIPSDADAAALGGLLAERVQAETAFKEASVAAERAQQDTNRLAEASKKAQEILRKSMEDRKKALAPVLKDNDALVAEQKKREAEAQRAEAAAMEARKAADAAKAALETLAEQSASKLEAVKKADDELKQLAQEVAVQARQADDLGKTQTQLASLRQQAGLGLQQVEREKALIVTTIEKAKNAAAEAMRAQNQTKIAELLRQVRPIEAEIKKANDVLAQLKELGDAGVAASKPISERLATSSAELKKLQDEISKLGGASVAPALLPKHSPPAKSSSRGSENGTNSLGMEFIRIGDVDFSKNLVTRRDFEGFAVERGLKGGAWRSPGFAQDAAHPVVNVTWKEADAFCKWLTERELKSGALSPNESYRLPTDLEWSHAVGLPSEQGATPEERDLGVDGVFPWGLDWPPPQGAGNYAGEETESEVRLQGYRDEYQWTSPVGAFKPNKLGLNDMGGNVWQWTSDYFNGAKDRRVLRGGSWYNGGMKQALLSSCRYGAKPDESNDTYGFRVVKTHDSTKTGANQK